MEARRAPDGCEGDGLKSDPAAKETRLASSKKFVRVGVGAPVHAPPPVVLPSVAVVADAAFTFLQKDIVQGNASFVEECVKWKETAAYARLQAQLAVPNVTLVEEMCPRLVLTVE